VPSETTVRPIKSGDMPKLRAREAEPLTNLSALQTSTAMLKKMVSEATSKMFNPDSENSWLLKCELPAIARVVRNNYCHVMPVLGVQVGFSSMRVKWRLKGDI